MSKPHTKKRQVIKRDAAAVLAAYTRFAEEYRSPVALLTHQMPGLVRVAKEVLGPDDVDGYCYLGLISALHVYEPEKSLTKYIVQLMAGQIGNALSNRLSRNGRLLRCHTLQRNGEKTDGLHDDPAAPVPESDRVELDDVMGRYAAMTPGEQEILRMRVGMDGEPLSFAEIADRIGGTAASAEGTYRRAVVACRGRWEEDAPPRDDLAADLEYLRDGSEGAAGYHSVRRVVNNKCRTETFQATFGSWYAPYRRNPRAAAIDVVAFWRGHFGPRWQGYFEVRYHRAFQPARVKGGYLARVSVVRRRNGEAIGEHTVHVGRDQSGRPAEVSKTCGVRPVATTTEALAVGSEWVQITFGVDSHLWARRYQIPTTRPRETRGPGARRQKGVK